MSATDPLARGATPMSSPALDELYHCNSKHTAARLAFVGARQRRRRERTIAALYDAAKNRFKSYASAPQIALPRTRVTLATTLDAALDRRRSRRDLGTPAPSADELGTLLARAYGTCGERAGVLARPVPSGGGLYPLEIYVLQFPEGGLDEGVYHYHPGDHALERLRSSCDRARAADASMYPEIVARASLVLVVVADMPRTRVKYGERAYRLALLEAGHVSQNLYLVCAALGLGIVALDGFYDDRIHAVLDLDGVNEIALVVFAVGRA
ncbi:MAG: SagB/ThcOx family dehydrogenase [Deltaproteobacteria bacterium]|nr:MAG: SagB/ThcOx family dehydrogenase [Deltaproteobacteria bacterium]